MDVKPTAPYFRFPPESGLSGNLAIVSGYSQQRKCCESSNPGADLQLIAATRKHRPFRFRLSMGRKMTNGSGAQLGRTVLTGGADVKAPTARL